MLCLISLRMMMTHLDLFLLSQTRTISIKNYRDQHRNFFWIYEIGNHKDPIAANFMADIMKAVDFSVLKNMLGK